MATRLKTVEYAFDMLNSVSQSTLTNFSQLTLYLPENSKVFKSVELRVTTMDVNTSTSGTDYTARRIDLRLGSVAYQTQNNTNSLLDSGENLSILCVRDYTSYFNTNWSGTSMTCDVAVLFTLSSSYNQANVNARLYITYEYDDTSSTHIKTVYIPLDAPTGALATSRPASAIDTIPALDTYLPETDKTYRNIFIWFGANTNVNNTKDITISHQIDSETAVTTGVHEGAMSTALWAENIFKPTFTTSATHEYRVWANSASFNNAQIYMVVTYEFNPSTSTTIMNSLLLPMEWESPVGGSSADNFQRATRNLWIQEPETITLQRLALLTNYETPISLGSFLRIRVGTGSWVQHIHAASIVSGQCGLMTRNDFAFTFSRGLNVLQADSYSASDAGLPFNLSSLWIVNYTSGKHTDGVGSHNHTIMKNLAVHGTGAASLRTLSSSVSFIEIPESNYFINAAGLIFEWMTNSTNNATGVIIQAEKLVSEGGLEFNNIYVDPNACDPEVGIHINYAQARYLFKRWLGDPDESRIDIEAERRFRTMLPNITSSSTAGWHERLTSMVTYHSITFTVSGNISNSAGGTVDIFLHRADSGEKVLETSRIGNGAYSFTWYDNTEDVYCAAYEDGTHKGLSPKGKAV